MKAYEFVSNLHGYMAILACILLVILTVMTLIFYFQKKDLTFTFRKVALYSLITFHTQLLLGVAMLFLNTPLLSNMSYRIQGKMSLMEHIPANFTVVLLITVFYSMMKRNQKVTTPMLIMLLISLVLLGRTFILLNGVLQS